MHKCTLILIIFAIHLEHGICANYGRSGNGSGRSYVGSRNRYIGGSGSITTTTTTTTTTVSPNLTAKEYLQKHGTFSAWSLILVITCVIVTGLGFYYCVLCYPILCRKEKNYRFMDVSSTTTGQNSQSIQSGIDNFSEKHIEEMIHHQDELYQQQQQQNNQKH